MQLNTGLTTIPSQPGVPIRSVVNQHKMKGQYSLATLVCIHTNEWLLYDDENDVSSNINLKLNKKFALKPVQ